MRMCENCGTTPEEHWGKMRGNPQVIEKCRTNLRRLDASILRKNNCTNLIGKLLCENCYNIAIKHAEFPDEYKSLTR